MKLSSSQPRYSNLVVTHKDRNCALYILSEAPQVIWHWWTADHALQNPVLWLMTNFWFCSNNMMLMVTADTYNCLSCDKRYAKYRRSLELPDGVRLSLWPLCRCGCWVRGTVVYPVPCYTPKQSGSRGQSLDCLPITHATFIYHRLMQKSFSLHLKQALREYHISYLLLLTSSSQTWIFK